MKIIEPGHVYDLDVLDGFVPVRLSFVNRETTKHSGTWTQEVLRALIDRTQHCNRCLEWSGNQEIIRHLRMAIILHETRALERKMDKGEGFPERVLTGSDGHFALTYYGKG